MSSSDKSSPAPSGAVPTPSATNSFGSSSYPASNPSSAIQPFTTTQPSTSTSKIGFTYPREYSFPPFYTLQPNSSTIHAQLQKWSSLILAYCRHHKIFKLYLIEAIDTDLFNNKKIGRRLAIKDVREVVEYMKKEGRAEWIGDGRGEEKSVCWVWWRNAEEWAGVIGDWVDETGQKNTVLTLYELTESDATLGQDFHGMDPEVLQRALAILVKRGKAQIFGQEDQQGIKFF